MPDTSNSRDEKKIKLHIDPEIEYKYRDLFNIHISAEDVVLEFGNIQRGVQEQGAIKDIIVLSPANAIRLQQALAQSIENMQQRIKEFNEQRENKK